MTVLTVRGLWSTHTGDLIDIVHSRYCVVALTVLALVHLTTVLSTRDPIQCVCPVSGDPCSLLKTSCISKFGSAFAYNLSADEFDDSVAPTTAPLALPSYYLVAGLILLLQAGLFYAPALVWRELARCAGLLPDQLCLSAVEAGRVKDEDERQSAVEELSSQLQKFCTRQLRQRHRSYAFRWFYGSKLVFCSLAAKVLFCVNVVGQFYMLDRFLGTAFHDLGWKIMGRGGAQTSGGETNPTVLDFPTDVMCALRSPKLYSGRTTYVHCVLSLSPLNDLVFSLDWFLMVVAAVVSFVSLGVAVLRFSLFYCRRTGIRDRLRDIGDETTQDDDVIAQFERDFLSRDGLLLLTYIRSSGGSLLSDVVLEQLWTSFTESRAELEPMLTRRRWHGEETDVRDREEVGDGRLMYGDEDMETDSVYIPMVTAAAASGGGSSAEGKDGVEADLMGVGQEEEEKKGGGHTEDLVMFGSEEEETKVQEETPNDDKDEREESEGSESEDDYPPPYNNMHVAEV